MRLLLHAGGSLLSSVPAMQQHLAGCSRIVLIPYAQGDWDRSIDLWNRRYAEHGMAATGVHQHGDPVAAVQVADAIVVMGGNTFRLLASLQRQGLIDPIRHRVLDDGVPYLGASAGTNVACPTIRTSNDMPIVEPQGFAALNLVPFQINPHYLDAPAVPANNQETREERIAEFLEENDVPVLGLREEAWLIVDDTGARLEGTGGAVLFRRGSAPQQLAAGQPDLRRLLWRPARFDVGRPDHALEG